MKLSSQLKDWKKGFGPTSLIAAVGIGPGTIASTLIAGSGFKYSLLWVAILLGICAGVIPYLVGHVTIVTNKTIIECLDEYIFRGWGKFNGWIQLIGNTAAAIFISISMASTLQVFFPSLSHFTLTFIMLIFTLIFVVLLGKFGVISSLTSILIAFLMILFVVNMFFIELPFAEAIKGIIPTIPKGSESAFIGMVGGAVGGSMMLYFSYPVKQARWTKSQLHILKWDNILLMGLPFSLISISVMLAGANIKTGPVADAVTAAVALEPTAGPAAMYIFVIGFLGAIYTTAVAPTFSTGYYLADMFKWKTKDGKDNLINGSDIHADSRFKIATAITLSGWLLGPLLADLVSPFQVITIAMGVITLFTPWIVVSVLYIASNKKIMGDFTIGWFIKLFTMLAFLFTCLGAWEFTIYIISL